MEELNPAILFFFYFFYFFIFYVYDDMVLLYYLLFFFRGRPNPFKILKVRFLLPVNVLVFFLLVKSYCNLLRINDKGKRGWYVALWG